MTFQSSNLRRLTTLLIVAISFAIIISVSINISASGKTTAGSSNQILTFSVAYNSPPGQQYYVGQGTGLCYPQSLEGCETVIPITGSISRLTVSASCNQGVPPCPPSNLGSPGTGETFTITLKKNGSPTTLACTISGAATTCTDSTNVVTFNQFDTVAVGIISSSNANLAALRSSAIFTP